MGEKEAERAAREYTGRLFFGRGGAWHFAGFDERHLEQCTLGGRLPMLSLEDALEVHLYSLVRQADGKTLFVTADKGILECGEGLDPLDVIKLLVR